MAPWHPRPTLSDARSPGRKGSGDRLPARGRGRAYLVERELEQDGNAALHALIADYVAVAERLQAIPMASVPLQSLLEQLA
ncbi:MAG: hypothetical protein M3065_21085, partial [Actinomycetota bacterium]|nr:hypothetical protein [Actinomycetota bacterium]